jgi:rhodanese-related sulfurtransferase
VNLIQRGPDDSGTALWRGVLMLTAAGIVVGLAVNVIAMGTHSGRALSWTPVERGLAQLDTVGTAAMPESAAIQRPAPEPPAQSPAPAPSPAKTGTVHSTTPPTHASNGATSAPPAATSAPPAASPANLPAVPDSRDPVEIHTADARRFHAAGAALFIDARGADEYAAGHIAGAVSVPFDEAFKDPKLVSAVDAQGRPIIVYCSGGDCEASKNLAYSLLGAGKKKVLVFTDGMPAWESAGYPVTKGTTP